MPQNSPAAIHIGTSGWSYDSWDGPFYPESLPAGERLEYYAGQFDTVEINNTFYSLPDERTVRNWHDSVPERFLFAVKASRYITHRKKLKDPEKSIGRFFEHIGPLAEKAGPVLFQLPPRWHENTGRLAEFLGKLPPDYRYAFEFRDPSWFNEEVYDLLKKHHAAFCIYDLGERRSPDVVTAGFVYIRLHGPETRYAGCYTQSQLSQWAEKVRKWQRTGHEVYLYFDNDENGYAARNAREIQEILTPRPQPRHL